MLILLDVHKQEISATRTTPKGGGSRNDADGNYETAPYLKVKQTSAWGIRNGWRRNRERWYVAGP